jgi:hypothetical protein
MRRPSLKLISVLVLAVAGVGLVSDRVLASAPTVKGKGKLFLSHHQVENLTANAVDLLEVPENQTFVLTDIICTNASANDNSIALLCVVPAVSTDNLMHQVEIAPDATFTHSFGTGLECPAGTTVRAVVTTGTASMRLSFTGYFRKGS